MSENEMYEKGKGRKGMPVLRFLFLLFLCIVGVCGILYMLSESVSNCTYETYVGVLDGERGKIENVRIKQYNEVPTGEVVVRMETGNIYRVYVPDVSEAEKLLQSKGLDYSMGKVALPHIVLEIYLPVAIVLIVVIIMVSSFGMELERAGGSNSKMMNFGKSRAKLSDSKTKFDDVAGLHEEKEELLQVVDFLKNPRKYTELGATIPKGVILTGPPGNGKTLLAKAVAGEAGVPFFSISGSDFMEMFVGVGASRVREMFLDAQHNSPCIVFIDEIDAIGRRRGTGMGGGHDEREQTLNQLLVEMDGFNSNSGIIVMAATNRVDILDPALLRPGRFDRRISVGLPDIRARKEILEVHSKKKQLGDDVNLDSIAATTPGFTGADLSNLLNEAAILAASRDRKYITMEDVNDAFIRVGVGSEKKSRVVSDKEKRIVAYHESGHALLVHFLPDMEPIHTISIIPTGNGAGGYTMREPEKDNMLDTKGEMFQNIVVCLGGRIAEELVMDDITTGASEDIKQATSIAKAMVTQFGMSETIGLIRYDTSDEEVFIGRDLAHTRSYSEQTAARIDHEVERLIGEAYRQGKEIIENNRAKLEAVASALLEKEKIDRAEFEAIMNQ